MKVLNKQGDRVTAELYDPLNDRLNTLISDIRNSLADYHGDRTLKMIELAYHLANEYTPDNESDTEDCYFLHYKEADQALTELQLYDKRDLAYKRQACIALLIKKTIDFFERRK